MKRTLLFVALAILITFLFILKSINPIQITQNENQQENIPNQENLIIFKVEIPLNTPSEDTVWIYFGNQKGYKMNKISDFLYERGFKFNEINSEDNNVKYRYSRNGNNYNTAEFLEPDSNDFFWKEKGRSVLFENGKIQEDRIKRWRWFPSGNAPIIRTSSLVPVGTFLPRINSDDFRSGQIIEDLYVPAYDDFFISTAKHLKETGYNWVELDPPLQLIINLQGMPEVRNIIENNPNYPSMDKLKEEI